MELSAPLLKNYLSRVNGILANGDGCLPCQTFQWGKDPMVSTQLPRLCFHRMTDYGGGVVWQKFTVI
jgi:hypothetical protein